MFELDEEENRPKALHHPFTSPKKEDLTFLESDPYRVKSDAYDLALNGFELGGEALEYLIQNYKKEYLMF